MKVGSLALLILCLVSNTAALAGTFFKGGNNGTVSCETYCKGERWGQVGSCEWAQRRDTMMPVACDVATGRLDEGYLLCACSDGPPQENRLEPIWDQSIAERRCASQALRGRSCKRIQEEAHERCALNRTEELFMQENGVVPFCDFGDILAVCSCGCFDAGTLIAVEGPGWKPVEAIERSDAIYKLQAESSLSRLVYHLTGLRDVVSGAESTELFAIGAANGGELTLSQHHAVLLGDGTMIAARDLRVGMQLVAQDGTKVSIVSIDRRPAKDGKVYNVLTNGRSKAEHLILANGFIVGDLIWQNTLSDELGAIALRE